LAAGEAKAFHRWQAHELASAGAEYLLIQTIPAVSEAEGMARAMIATGVPSIISFCINRSGKVLDGCPLDEAIARLDETTGGALIGYMVNCSHAYSRMLSPISSRIASSASAFPWRHRPRDAYDGSKTGKLQ
jgi:S-methylmethionine-dependent homocysteine/selenocysteine methylase